MQKTTPKLTAALALAGLSLGTLTSNAAVIISTGFDGTNDGTEMTGITWTTSGLAADPASSLSPDSVGLKSGGNTGSHFVGDFNIGNSSTFETWSFTVDFTTGGLGVSLSDIDIQASNFNSGSTWQLNARDQSYTVEILNASNAVVGSLTGTTPDFTSNNGTDTNSFDVGGTLRSYEDNYTFSSAVALNASTAYQLKISIAEGTNDAGNYGGINSFSLNGTVVPEPSTAMLLGVVGVLGLMARRKRA